MRPEAIDAPTAAAIGLESAPRGQGCAIAAAEGGEGECALCRVYSGCGTIVDRIACLYARAYETPKVDSADVLRYVSEQLGMAIEIEPLATELWEYECDGHDIPTVAAWIAGRLMDYPTFPIEASR
jgi:hypothetical protein